MKLYLSSLNTGKIKQHLESARKYKPKYLLYSYLYLKNKSEEEIETWLNLAPYIMIDSGAHTFQKEGQETDFEKFVYEYSQFVKKYSKISYFVELDIENKVGLPQVEKWRNYLIKDTGKQPIVVWHRERGWDYYKYMVKEYDYVGFSGFVVDATGGPEVPDRFINLFCDTAHENNAQIHGFGYTRKDVYKYRFDSVDSASWTAGVRFGRLDKFNGKHLVKGHELSDYGVLYEKIADHQLREWTKYQVFLDALQF